MVELKPYREDYYIWKYLPSIPLAAAFAAAFLLLTSLLSWRTHNTYSLSAIPFLIGSIFQVLGYALRILCHFYTNQLGPYIVQAVLILLAPVFYAASIYMVLGRIIRSIHAEGLSPIRPSRLTKLFVLGDIIALNLQGNGGGLTGKDSTRKIGEAIITVGLFLQIVIFALFCGVAIVFHKRMNTHEEGRRIAAEEHARALPWRGGLWMLYTCSALITFRNVFRVVEYIMGTEAYLLSTEWPAYALDGVPMLVVQIIFLVWFPAALKVPPSPDVGAESGVSDGSARKEEERKEKKRKINLFTWMPSIR